MPEEYNRDWWDIIQSQFIDDSPIVITRKDNVKTTKGIIDKQRIVFIPSDLKNNKQYLTSTFLDYVELIRTYILNKYENENVPIGQGNKSEEKILDQLRKYDKLSINGTLCYDDSVKHKLLRNFNKFGNQINHWFPSMLDTKIFISKNKQESIIDQFRDKDGFLDKMISLLLQDRMHLWTSRKTVYDKDNKKIGYDIFVNENEIGKLKIFPKIIQTFRLGLGSQPQGQFPTQISKYIWRLGINTIKLNTYDYYDNLYLYDPCQGWGSRMISVFQNNDYFRNLFNDIKVNYLVNDVNEETHNTFNKIYDYWNENVNDISNIHVDKEKIPQEHIQNSVHFEKYKGKVHIQFTSPPYFKKEMYDYNNDNESHNYSEYENWSNNFLKPMINNTCELLRKGGIFFLNIQNVKTTGSKYLPLQEDSIKYQEECGLELEDTFYMVFSIQIGNNKNKQDNIENNNGKKIDGKFFKTEPIYMFRKK